MQPVLSRRFVSCRRVFRPSFAFFFSLFFFSFLLSKDFAARDKRLVSTDVSTRSTSPEKIVSHFQFKLRNFYHHDVSETRTYFPLPCCYCIIENRLIPPKENTKLKTSPFPFLLNEREAITSDYKSSERRRHRSPIIASRIPRYIIFHRVFRNEVLSPQPSGG